MTTKKICTLLLLIAGALFTSCSSSDEPNESVTYNYELIFNGDSANNLLPEPSDGLNELQEFYETKTSEITNKIKTKNFSIEGKGDTQDEAKKDADEQAIRKFKSLLDELNSDVPKFEESFINKRTELASKILIDNPKAHVRYTNVGPFMRRKEITDLGEKIIIVATGDVIDKLEAIGGEDYSK